MTRETGLPVLRAWARIASRTDPSRRTEIGVSVSGRGRVNLRARMNRASNTSYLSVAYIVVGTVHGSQCGGTQCPWAAGNQPGLEKVEELPQGPP